MSLIQMGLLDELLAGPLAGFPVLHGGAGVGFCFTSIPVSTHFLRRASAGTASAPPQPLLHSPGVLAASPAWACTVPLQPTELLLWIKYCFVYCFIERLS